MGTFIIVLVVILVIFYIHHKAYLEPFISSQSNESNKPTSLLIFVSKSCKHCVDYNEKYHDSVVKLAKKKDINVKRIFSDEDPENLFEKFKVTYVPACFVMKGNEIYKNLGSNVNPQSIQSALA